MNCRESANLLETFHDGELDGRQMREVALHVSQCADCERQLLALEKVGEALRTSVAEAPEDLSGLWGGIATAIDREAPTGIGWGGFRIAAAAARFPRGRMGVLQGGVALAASLFLAVFLWGSDEPKLADISVLAQSPQTTAIRSSLEVPEVARGNDPIARSIEQVQTAFADIQKKDFQQVQIHSLRPFGGEMALWEAPAENTAVIWLGDAAPRARR